MNISKIIVKNYRSIKAVEIKLSKFSIFVGQNNHGKTNFFEAIEWFYNARSTQEDEYFNRDPHNKISVQLFFEGVVDSDIEKLKTNANKTKIRNLLNGAKKFSVLKTSSNHKRRYIVNGEDKGNPQGLDAAINEFLPKLEYINTKIRLEDVSSYKARNPIATMLSGVLSTIIADSEEYDNFKKQFATLFEDEKSEVRKELNKLGSKVEIYLRKQFPDGTSVKFKVNPPQFNDLLKSFDTTVNDGVETKAEDKGDGMQRALMLSIIQAFADYRRQKSGGGQFLFLIDEAELHLHPSAQRLLKTALLDISKTDQVLINTHSSVFIVDKHKNQQIFKVEKNNKITSIKLVDAIDRVNVIFDLLGGSPADLLLPRNFIIVEGRSEFEFLNIIIKNFYPQKYTGIKIIYAGGDIDEQKQNLHAIHKLLVPITDSDNPIYRDKVIVLVDKPNKQQEKKYRDFQEGYPYLFKNGQVFELPTETLEAYYPYPYARNKGEIENDQKVEYAKHVAQNITQKQFENKMTVIYEALKKANELSFNPQ